MPSPATRLEDALRKALSPADLPIAIALLSFIQRSLADDPAVIEELAPGKRLVERRMTTKERSVASLRAANAELKRRRQIRLEVAAVEIRRALAANPAMTLPRLADWLENAGIKPMRRPRWDGRGVGRVMKDMGIDRQSPQA